MSDESGISSAAVKAGVEYEQKIFDILFPIFGQGNMSDKVAFNTRRPDIMLKNKSKSPIRFEIKANLGADYGEKAITIDEKTLEWIPVKTGIKDKSNKMHVEYAKRIDELYKTIFEELDLHSKIVNAWGLPSSNNDMSAYALLDMIKNRQLSRSLHYQRILSNLDNKFDPYKQATVASNVLDKIVKYYNSKKVYYIQIKDKGLYYLGHDLYQFNNKFAKLGMTYFIPNFNPSECRLELRGKTSKSDATFRPVLRFKISGLAKSQVSLDDPIFANALHKIMWS